MTKKTLSKKEQPLFSQNRMINIIWLKKFVKLRIQIKILSQSFLWSIFNCWVVNKGVSLFLEKKIKLALSIKLQNVFLTLGNYFDQADH